MHRPIAFNLVRTMFSALNCTPRGVDRIDFGYLSHLFESWSGEIHGVLPTPIGMRFFPRDRVLRGRDLLARMWKEHDILGEDPAMKRLRAACAAAEMAIPAQRTAFRAPNVNGWARVMRLLFEEGINLGRPVRSLPQRTLYLDVGHYGMTLPIMLNWLGERPDVTPVFMLHDAIPLRFPDLVATSTVVSHQAVMKAAARWAQAVITPTAAAGQEIREELAARGRHDVRIHPLSLPIDGVFHHGIEPDPTLADRPFFLVCGAIEPRKNHALLIEVWKRLVDRRGRAVPRLIVAGSPGHGSREILGHIAAQKDLAGHVVFATGLSTPSIARLMAGARALLMPSLAEGYGLPPVEAITMGTPAILSDIPAHREAAGSAGFFAGTNDVEAWTALVEQMTDDTPLRADALGRVTNHVPLDWPTYMARVGSVLAEIE